MHWVLLLALPAVSIVFTAEDAKEWGARGEKVVLVRLETSPEDIEGMKAAQGISDRSRRYDLSMRRL